MVNPLGTVTTTLMQPHRGGGDQHGHHDYDLDAQFDSCYDEFIHENCDEALFRPVVAVFGSTGSIDMGGPLPAASHPDAIARREQSRPTDIGQTLVLPVIELQQELQQRSAAKTKAAAAKVAAKCAIDQSAVAAAKKAAAVAVAAAAEEAQEAAKVAAAKEAEAAKLREGRELALAAAKAKAVNDAKAAKEAADLERQQLRNAQTIEDVATSTVNKPEPEIGNAVVGLSKAAKKAAKKAAAIKAAATAAAAVQPAPAEPVAIEPKASNKVQVSSGSSSNNSRRRSSTARPEPPPPAFAEPPPQRFDDGNSIVIDMSAEMPTEVANKATEIEDAPPPLPTSSPPPLSPSLAPTPAPAPAPRKKPPPPPLSSAESTASSLSLVAEHFADDATPMTFVQGTGHAAAQFDSIQSSIYADPVAGCAAFMVKKCGNHKTTRSASKPKLPKPQRSTDNVGDDDNEFMSIDMPALMAASAGSAVVHLVDVDATANAMAELNFGEDFVPLEPFNITLDMLADESVRDDADAMVPTSSSLASLINFQSPSEELAQPTDDNGFGTVNAEVDDDDDDDDIAKVSGSEADDDDNGGGGDDNNDDDAAFGIDAADREDNDNDDDDEPPVLLYECPTDSDYKSLEAEADADPSSAYLSFDMPTNTLTVAEPTTSPTSSSASSTSTSTSSSSSSSSSASCMTATTTSQLCAPNTVAAKNDSTNNADDDDDDEELRPLIAPPLPLPLPLAFSWPPAAAPVAVDIDDDDMLVNDCVRSGRSASSLAIGDDDDDDDEARAAAHSFVDAESAAATVDGADELAAAAAATAAQDADAEKKPPAVPSLSGKSKKFRKRRR